MPSLARHTGPLWDLDTVYIYDDFTEDIDAAKWTVTVSDSGTVAVGDEVGGVVTFTPSDGTVADNDEAYLASANEVYKFADGKPLYAQALLQFSEANTDDANVFFGFMNAIGANAIVDNGAGLKADFSGACIYKVDGETVWRCITSNGTAQTISVSTTTAGGAAYQKLEIVVTDWDGVEHNVVFKVNGNYLKDSHGNVIRHRVAIANATEMQIGAGVKNGSTNLQTLKIDMTYSSQLR